MPMTIGSICSYFGCILRTDNSFAGDISTEELLSDPAAICAKLEMVRYFKVYIRFLWNLLFQRTYIYIYILTAYTLQMCVTIRQTLNLLVQDKTFINVCLLLHVLSIYIYINTYVFIYICVSIHMYIYIHTSKYTYIKIYIYI